MQQDSFKKQLLGNVFVIAGSMLVASIAIFILASRISAAALAISTFRAQAAGDAAEFQALAGLQQDAAAATAYQGSMAKLLPPQASLITFPAQVQALATADGVTTSFSFQGSATPSAAGVPGALGFSLDVSGPFASILAFMKDFEVSAPIFLSSIDATSLAGSGADYTLAAQGRVFFQ